MNATLPSGLLISALLKRTNDAGGMGMVRARGEPDSGAILLILNDTDGSTKLRERARGPSGQPTLVPAGPVDPTDAIARESYWRRRRAQDPDLWVVELDIVSPERFAAETILAN